MKILFLTSLLFFTLVQNTITSLEKLVFDVKKELDLGTTL